VGADPGFSGRKEHVGRTAADNRVFVNGVLWVLRSGARWHDLPERYGKYKSVHKRFVRWAQSGVWDRIFQELVRDRKNQYIHCWNLRWQVWYGGYFSGNSRHCAPVPRTQNTPFSTARVSCHGRPRLSSRRCGRSTGSTTTHCSSVSSQRPVIGAWGDHRAAPGSHEISPLLFMRLVLEAVIKFVPVF
jgi:hypothetical protein